MWIKTRYAGLLNTDKVQNMQVMTRSANGTIYAVEATGDVDKSIIMGLYRDITEAYKVLEEIYAALGRGDKVYTMPV